MRRRTVLGDLIYMIGGIALFMLLLVASASYFLVTFRLQRSLEEASERTAKAISKALEIPLLRLDAEWAANLGIAYLAGGRNAGMRIESAELGIVLDRPPYLPNALPPVAKEIWNQGTYLGEMTLWFDDGPLQEARRGLLLMSLSMIIGILAAYPASILLIVRKAVSRPLNSLISGIEAVGSGNYGMSVPLTRRADLDVLVEAFNRMSSNVKRSQELLDESERRYGVVFDSSVAAIFIHDAEGRIVDLNRSAMELVGADSREEATGYGVKEDLSSSDRDPEFLVAAWKEALAGKDLYFPWTVRRPKDGGIVPVEISLRRIRLGSGPYLLASVTDVTERKKIEEQLVQAQKMEAIGTIAGGLAHDFNNILGGITGTASVLQYMLDGGMAIVPEMLGKALRTIQDASFRAANVVGKLLTLSKGRSFEAGVVDLKDALSRVMTIAENSIDKSVDLECEWPEEPVRVMGDRTQIEQVALNLIVNGAHAMTVMRPKGARWGGRLLVSLSGVDLGAEDLRAHPDSPPGRYAMLKITDEGIGISAEDRERIFLPFYTTKERGSGLGLPMVYGIVKAHEGFVELDSEPGDGTEVRVLIPRTDLLPEERPLGPRGTSEWRGEGLVLVVDDEDALRDGLKGMLEQFGYSVETARDGEEGLLKYEELGAEISLVFLDMSMPKLSGREVFFAIRRIDPEARVVLMSGVRQDERVAEAMEGGVAAFLQKPFDRARLVAALRAATERPLAGA